jgi:hypothetical protein
MLMVRPSVEFVCLTFALFQLGAVVILIDPGMGYANLLRCIASVRPDILVGIGRAILFSHLFRRPFASVRQRILVGRNGSFFKTGLYPFTARMSTNSRLLRTTCRHHLYDRLHRTAQGRGVHPWHFSHPTAPDPRLFRHWRGRYRPAWFSLFGLFATALGAQAVIPDMDPTRRPWLIRKNLSAPCLIIR